MGIVHRFGGLALCAILAILYWAGQRVPGDQPGLPEPPAGMSARQIAREGESVMRDNLKDGLSAEFKDVTGHPVNRGGVACGMVNSKNSFGAFTGYKRFIASANGEVVMVEDEADPGVKLTGAPIFPAAWTRFCGG